MSDPDMTSHLGPTRSPATLALRCPYCGVGTIDPVLEYTGFAHSEHRDCTGFECEHCMAEWDRDGNPTQGSHIATLAIEARRAELDATQGTATTTEQETTDA